MRSEVLGRESLRPWAILASVAAATMFAFLVLTKIVGPLNPDEVMFSHVLWLTLEGKRQYIDFYSYHLPTYFYLHGLMLPQGSGDSLSFIWAVRLSNLAIVAVYAALLVAVERRTALYLMPLLFLMLAVSRMVEVRPDTFGLVAFNASWALLLLGKPRRWVALAAALAIFGAACSARGIIMGVGFGAALAWLAFVKRDRRFVVIPAAVLLGAFAMGIAAYALEPAYVELMLRSSLLDPGSILPWLSLTERIVALDRAPQILLAVTALLLSAAAVFRRQDRAARSGVIAIASLAQLSLIFVDPSPFPYVYGWAMIPCLAGLSLADTLFDVDISKTLAALDAACAAAIASVTIAYPLVGGRMPPVGSNYRVLPDDPIDGAAIGQMPLEKLVALELSREHQQSLANQLLVREELCRRIDGRALSAWQSHPICVHDATYYWFSVKWPGIGRDSAPAERKPWFERMFTDAPPDLFIWEVPGASPRLSEWVLSLLGRYKVEPGFAIRADLTALRTDSSDRAAIRSHNDRN